MIDYDPAIPLEQMCQKILNDVLGPGAPTLDVEGETGFMVMPYEADPPPRTVMEAMNEAARVAWMIGWEIVAVPGPPVRYVLRPCHSSPPPEGDA